MKSMAWLALVAVALGAQASEEDSTPCDNVETDAQNYACAAYNKQTAERELKSAFDDLIQRITDQYPDENDKVQQLTARLQAAETLWTQLRDADCKVETFAESPAARPSRQPGTPAWPSAAMTVPSTCSPSDSSDPGLRGPGLSGHNPEIRSP